MTVLAHAVASEITRSHAWMVTERADRGVDQPVPEIAAAASPSTSSALARRVCIQAIALLAALAQRTFP